MKTIKRYTFEVPRSNGQLPFRFSVYEMEDGSVQVSSIHPYDETEYHWARKSPRSGMWHIIRKGNIVSSVGTFIGDTPICEPLSPEQIAYFLIKADEDAQLKPRRAIW